MRLIIKVKPEDFQVEEVASLPLTNKGDFGAYVLKKRGWNTVELLQEISRRLHIPFVCFSYGGRKDRHGLTIQHIAIQGRRTPELQGKDYALEFLGFMERPLGPDLIEGNRFTITVRKLNRGEIVKSLAEIQAVEAFGYPNYFDDQRFGSADARQGFMAEKVLKEQWNGALKIYLTSMRLADKKAEKERKKFLFANWRDWKACQAKAKTEFEKRAFVFLGQHPQSFLDLLKRIPRQELSAHFSSYQSYLWNEILRRVLVSAIPGPYQTYAGLAGDYIFYTHLTPDGYRYLEGLTMPVPGTQAHAADRRVRDTYAQVLAENGLKNSLFHKIKLRQAFLKSFPRRAIVRPRDLRYDILDDELYVKKKKLLLKFELGRGSYATMLLKRVFSF